MKETMLIMMNNNAFSQSSFDGSFLNNVIKPIIVKMRTPNTAIKKISKYISVNFSLPLGKIKSSQTLQLVWLLSNFSIKTYGIH